jgi:carnosine N-methyltransferase
MPRTTEAKSHRIHPYLHSFSNHLTTPNLLRSVQIPDVCPANVLGNGLGGPFSLVAGDFEDIYGAPGGEAEEGHKGKWAAVVTCFFIDCVSSLFVGFVEKRKDRMAYIE